jgi:hypothetical protein
MNQPKDAQTRLWLRNLDSLGNIVDRRLIEAADRVWERARLVVICYLAEDTSSPRTVAQITGTFQEQIGEGSRQILLGLRFQF